MKRLLDVTCSVMGLLFFLPLLLLTALAIKLDSAGPVFHRGVRVGRFGRPFRIFKFRTMVVNAEKMGGPSTADGDPRLTRLGRFLRKYKVDELPQLLNVLQGEMSLVGPRPEVPIYVALLTEAERKIVLSVRPGITDWASLWTRMRPHSWREVRTRKRRSLRRSGPKKSSGKWSTSAGGRS